MKEASFAVKNGGGSKVECRKWVRKTLKSPAIKFQFEEVMENLSTYQ